MLCLPELPCSRFTEFIEGPNANHRFKFFASWRNAVEEISHRSKRGTFMGGNYCSSRAGRKSFDVRQRHPDGLALREKCGTGLVDGRRHEFQPESMTFQYVNKRMVKAFAVRE